MPAVGVEPTTIRLKGGYSTIELHQPICRVLESLIVFEDVIFTLGAPDHHFLGHFLGHSGSTLTPYPMTRATEAGSATITPRFARME